jgi:hypothetical protein
VLALTSVTTMFIVFFARDPPKVSVVRNGEGFATSRLRCQSWIIDVLLAPLRDGAVFLVGMIFKVTGFSKDDPRAVHHRRRIPLGLVRGRGDRRD